MLKLHISKLIMVSEKISTKNEYKTLLQMKPYINYKVVGFSACDELVRRFFALGIRKGASVSLIKFSYLAYNLMINVEGVVYAIKSSLANLILVKEA